MTTIITTGSGVVLYSSASSLGPGLPKAVAIFNQMVTDTYVNFTPSLISESGNVKTYVRENHVVKSTDVADQGSVIISVVYSSLSEAASKEASWNSYLNRLLRIIEKQVLSAQKDEVIEKLKKYDIFSLKRLMADVDFPSFAGHAFESEFRRYYEDLDSEDVKDEKETIDKTESRKKTKKSSKISRKWTADGGFVDGSKSTTLDFTEPLQNDGESSDNVTELASGSFGHVTKDGFVIDSLSLQMDDNEKGEKKKSALSIFSKFLPIGKVIQEEDLEKPSNAIKESLIRKNVSAEIADKLVSSLAPKLVGRKLLGFASIENEVRSVLASELTKILTPNTSIDLLHEISKKKKANAPYVISVVGVNGVGKSTNLSKLAYWFLNNKYNVLIAACDTFRSGAVEQLKVHERNLNKLIANSEHLNSKLKVFEQGYGNVSKVALIAKNSIEYAKKNGYDIVLMDTAGRSHSDSKLMAPLKDFALAANPDKIIMVGEALVGTDSLMQARNFNKSFKGANKKLDFFIISKCDTVGDLIGTLVNMVYSTGIPILFVGVGQTYTDLRALSVEWAVNILTS